MIAKRIVIVAAAAAAVLFTVDAASAQGMGRGPVASACAPEIQRYCAHERHGYGGVRGCLEANRKRLSGRCKYVLNNTGWGWRSR